MVLGFAAQALVAHLAALVEDGDLTHRTMHAVGNARDLAAAVAKIVSE